jgi:hypothetical protein
MQNGKWNPEVRNDLENRLRAGHIDLADRFSWMKRYPRARIERKQSPKAITKQSWAIGPIRDCEVEIVDAIRRNAHRGRGNHCHLDQP